MQKAIQASLRPAFLLLLQKFSLLTDLLNIQGIKSLDRPYFPLKVILYNVRR